MERDTKQQSWNQIREFYDDFINDSEFSPEWDYLMPLLRLVETIAKSKRATKFRAGQSHEALIICTSETNTTYPKPAFVGVRMARDHVSFLLEYWKEAGNLVEKRICREEEILPVLDEFLAKLWKNTKGADTEGIA